MRVCSWYRVPRYSRLCVGQVLRFGFSIALIAFAYEVADLVVGEFLSVLI